MAWKNKFEKAVIIYWRIALSSTLSLRFMCVELVCVREGTDGKGLSKGRVLVLAVVVKSQFLVQT